MTVYVFFAYVKDMTEASKFPLIKRYLIPSKTNPMIRDDDCWDRRVMYAYTTKKIYRDLFMLERDMNRFGCYPSKMKLMKDQYEQFDLQFMGRELELRGIRNHKILPRKGTTNILATSDEFSYVMYEYFSSEILEHLDLDFPISAIFKKKYRNALHLLEYPFEDLSDVLDGYGWFNLENRCVLDEPSAFVNAFGNLYRTNWEDFI